MSGAPPSAVAPVGAADRALSDVHGPALVEHALADPVAYLSAYRAELDGAPARRQAELLRGAGVACREQRDLDQSFELLQQAAAIATEVGDAALAGLVQLSLSATVLYRGDATRAIELVTAAAGVLDGDDRFLALAQRAGLLHRAGRIDEALGAFADADAARGPVPTAALAELHNNRGILLGYLGRLDESAADVTAARAMFADLGYPRRAVDMTHNLGWLAGRRGDVVGALALFDEAEEGHAALGLPADAVPPDRCEVLLAAGLVHEALGQAQRVAATLAASGDAADHAEALVVLARIALRTGDVDRAGEAARQAADIFHRSGRLPWAAHATALMVDAYCSRPEFDPARLDGLDALREQLLASDLVAAVAEVDLLHARGLLALGRVAEAATVVDRIDVRRLAAHVRPAARAVRARVAARTGDRRAAWRELHRGLRELAAVRDSLGAAELRVSLGLHGDDVLAAGLELALATRRPSSVLVWSERGRARSLHHPRVAPVPESLARSLDELRRVDRERVGGAERAAAARAVRRASRGRASPSRASSSRVGPGRVGAPATPDGLDVAALRARLGDRVLVEIVNISGRTVAVVVDARRARLVELAGGARWTAAGDQARRSLERVLSGRGDDRMRAAGQQALVTHVGQLDELLEPVARLLPDGAPVVLVPTADLHAVPWGATATFGRRAWCVAPSAVVWAAAHDRQSAAASRSRPLELAAFAGPGLDAAYDEVVRLREAFGAPRTSATATATAAQALAASADVLAALGTADVVHLACHGRFVADNPLLSTLELADGPFYVHDVERATGCPTTVVLSACSGALSAHRPGDELLGFVSSLLGAGAANVVAACVKVPDGDALAEAMLGLHSAIRAGTTVAAALRDVRAADPLLGAAFAAHGAAC